MKNSYISLKILGSIAVRAIECMHDSGILPRGSGQRTSVSPVGAKVIRSNVGEVDVSENVNTPAGPVLEQSHFGPSIAGKAASVATPELEMKGGPAETYRSLASICVNKAISLDP